MKKLSILVVAGLLCLMALPAFAQDKADWAFYGSVRFWTSWEDWDQEAPTATNFGAPGTKRSGNYVVGTQRFDDSDLWWGQQYNARIGANVKWGNVAGRFEYGHLNVEGSPTGSDTAHIRLLYGDWNFGPGVLRIGQDYTPFFYTISQQCGPSGGDCSGIGFGSLYGGRQDQIKLIMGGFQVALVEPSVRITGLSATATNDTDKIIPKIEASYNFNLGPANIFIGGGYNTIDAVYVVGGSEKEISVDSWGIGIGAKVPIGPFYANAAFSYLRNPGNYGFGQNAPLLLTTLVNDSNPATSGTDDTEDLDVWTGALALGFNLTSTMNFEAGVFMVDASTKTTGAFGGAPFGQDVTDTLWAYYVMMNWSPAKNVFISPEIGLVDFGKAKIDGRDDDDLGDMFYVGIKWMINF